VAAAVYVFWLLSPLVYGEKWTRSSCEGARLAKHWDFECSTFFDDINQYDDVSEEIEATTSIVEDVLSKDEL